MQFDKLTKDEYIEMCGFTTEQSPSELDVFLLRSKGMSLQEIAFKLDCDKRTVDRRIQRIKKKILIYEFKKSLLGKDVP